jgi:fructosamine-3-kinase
MINIEILETIKGALSELGETGEISVLRPVNSNIAVSAFRIETDHNKYFLKYAEPGFYDMIAREYSGLQRLKASRCVRTPQIYKYYEGNGTSAPYLFMEWIESNQDIDGNGQRRLGEDLAALHDASSEIYKINQFGLEENNFIGFNIQENQWMNDWPDFFVVRRLTPQIQLGVRKGLIKDTFHEELFRLCEKVPEILSADYVKPTLIHGDLWGGNVLYTVNHEPVLIDPAVYFGVPEAELAFTELFGGFGNEFYEAYDAVLPIPYGYQDRKKLYNLYHILNHLNLFGEMYLGQAQSVCRYYLEK